MNWCYECECKAKDCVCPDWHRHYKTNNKGIGGIKMGINERIIFELQNMRDCWLRGNLNTSTEFIDYIDERINILRGAR